MYRRTTGILIICNFFLLFLLIPFRFNPDNSNGFNVESLFLPIISIGFGLLLLSYIHFIFKGVSHMRSSKYGSYSKPFTLKSYLFTVLVFYFIFESIYVIIIATEAEFVMSFNSVFSFVLIYLVGGFYFILVMTYDPVIPKGMSKRRLSKIGSEEELW